MAGLDKILTGAMECKVASDLSLVMERPSASR